MAEPGFPPMHYSLALHLSTVLPLLPADPNHLPSPGTVQRAGNFIAKYSTWLEVKLTGG